MSEQRPSVRIRLRYDMESGAFDLIVDDSAPDMPEDYHDRVAEMVANFLTRNPQISDAGLRHVVWNETEIPMAEIERTGEDEEEDLIVD